MLEQAPVDIVDVGKPERRYAATDRCDTCRAQAWASATVNGSQLLFCMHHYRKGEERLILIATECHVDVDGFEASA